MKKEILMSKIGQKKGNLQLKQALHYTKTDSIKDGRENDVEFLRDVKQISQKKQSTLKNFSLLSSEVEVISQEQCEEIHEIALLHKQANLFNSTSMLQASELKPEDFCECNCQRGKGQPFPLCMDEQGLAFLGPGVLLIFFYLKQVRWTLLLVFLTYGVFSLFTNILMADSDYCWELCSSYTGMDLYFCYLTEISSFKRKIGNDFLIQFQVWLGFIMCIIWIFSIKFIKHLGDSKNEEIDEMLDSASDYTVRIDNLPSRKYNQYDLIDYVKELWNTRQTISADNLSEDSASHFCNSPKQNPVDHHQLRVRSIQLIYNMEDCRSIISDVLNLSYEIAKCFEDFDQGGDDKSGAGPRRSSKKSSIRVENPKLAKSTSITSNENSIFRSSSILENIRFRKNSQKNVVTSTESKIKQGMQEKYIELKNKLISRYTQLNDLRTNFLKDSEYRKKLSTTCALLEFESNQQQKEFLSYFSTDLHKNSIERFFCQSKKFTFKGADIQINRAAQPSDMIWLNCEKQFSLARYIIILMGAFMVLVCSYTLIHFLRTSSLFKGSNTYLNAIMVQCFNRIIWISLSNLVVLEYNNTKTDSIISLMKLSITAQVINVIVSPLIFNFFVNDNKIYGFGGMSGNVVIYQFIMFVMMTFFYVLNPFYYFKKVILMFKSTRNIMIRNLCEVVGQVDTIDEIRPVLSYYEGPEFPIAGGYVYMTTAIFHTLFYCHLEPIVIFFAIVNISGFLVIMKYILFRRCKIPELTEIQIFDFAMFGLSCGAASYGAGSLYFLVISQYSLGLDIEVSKYVPSCLCIIFWFISSMNPFDVFTKFNEFMTKYLGYDQKSIDEEDDTKSRVGNRRPELVEAGNLLLKIFEQQLTSKKAKRKQSYYQYSNVKKLLNYECELKEVIIGQEEKNNIIFFCESFCSHQKLEQFKKKSINAQPACKVEQKSSAKDEKSQEKPKFSVKRKNPGKTIPQRVSPNKKLDPLIVDSEKKKIKTKYSYEKDNAIQRMPIPRQTVHQQVQEEDKSSNKGTCKDQSELIPVIKL